MSFFTSKRERRFWFLALAAVFAIYSTVGLAGRMAERLREENLLGVLFGLGFVLVLAAIVGSTLKRRPGRREIWAILGVSAVYGMVVVRMGVTPEERTHLFEYGLVAILIHKALIERRANGRRVPVPAVLTVLATAALGWIDEVIQGFIPGRVYDIRDVGINAAAGLLAVSGSLVLVSARRRTHRLVTAAGLRKSGLDRGQDSSRKVDDREDG